MSEPYSNLRVRWGTAKAVRAKAILLFTRITGIHMAYLFVRPLDGNRTAPPLPAGYHLRVLSADEAEEFCQQPAVQLPMTFLREAKERNDYCVAAFKGDELVSYVWRSYHYTPVQKGITLNFETPIRYGYKALTLEAHRGLQLQQSLALHSDTKDLSAGYKFALSYIETHNYSSIASDKRRGNVVIGYIFWGTNRLFTTRITTPGARRRGIYLG